MPSTVRLDHSISGADLDALRAGGTAPRAPTSRPGQGVNAWMLMDGGRLWLVVLALSVVVIAVAAVGAWRSTVASGEWRVASQEKAAPTVAAPVAVPALATSPVPTATAAATPVPVAPAVPGEAIPPVMVVICDGQPYPLRTVGDLGRLVRSRGATWPRGCATDTDWWSVARQYAWQDAHP